MGIVAGVFHYQRRHDGHPTIACTMAELQKHRDSGEIASYADEYVDLAVANTHDSISDKRAPTRNNELRVENIQVLLDGIVLEVPRHATYLESKGHRIRARTCSAIIAAAYREWGVDFMQHLEGEFACAIWDGQERRLLLARDPYGHKPLHYYADNERCIFSSEIKGLLAADISREIDLLSLSDFLTMNCVPYPATIFKNVKQIPPGTVVSFSPSGISEQRYWYPIEKVDIEMGFEEAVSRLTTLLREAVRKRMMSKTTYCFLSGGIDSSAIVSFASELSAQPVHAISVSFEESEFDELEFAKAMAAHVGAIHHHVVAKPDHFFDMLSELVRHHDSPFTDTSSYPTYYAGKLAREFTDMILTGDGPDQTMAGSAHHVSALASGLFNNGSIIPAWLYKSLGNAIGLLSESPIPTLISRTRRNLYRKALSPVQAAYELRSYCPTMVKNFLCENELWDMHRRNAPFRHPESWFKKAEGMDDTNKYLFADIQFYVTDDLMIKLDRMCMAHGLETLSPFQDRELGKCILRMPGDFKLHVAPNGSTITKYILRKVCEKRFPAVILNKKKQGFGIPLEKWLRDDCANSVREVLLDERSLSRGYFKKEAIRKITNDFLEGRFDYYYANPYLIIALLTIEMWHRQYLD